MFSNDKLYKIVHDYQESLSFMKGLLKIYAGFVHTGKINITTYNMIFKLLQIKAYGLT